jgi:Protein of unknown function (DUF2490)
MILLPGIGYTQSVKNEFRFDVTIVHPIYKKLTGFSSAGIILNSDKKLNVYYIGFPGLTYSPLKWLQLWGGLKDFYTNNWSGENTNELRPYGGIRLLIPNTAKVHLYNFMLFEYRYIKKTESKSTQEYGRIRNRFGMEVPLNKKPWAPGTFYILADCEPFYRFDKNMVDVIRLRMGPGYVINEKFRLEAIWRMQLTRGVQSDPLDYTDNTFRINLRIATKEGLFKDLLHPDF